MMLPDRALCSGTLASVWCLIVVGALTATAGPGCGSNNPPEPGEAPPPRGGDGTSGGDAGVALYDVTASASAGGSIFPSGVTRVAAGYTLRLSLAPHAGYELESVSGCGGVQEGSVFVTAPVHEDCNVLASFAIPERPDTVTVTATGSGDGRVEPSGAQAVAQGSPVTLTLVPRVPVCDVVVSGSCTFQVNAAETEVTIASATENCTVMAAFDCGPSIIRIRPESVGTFWQNRTEQFTATQTYDSGHQVDVTEIVQWSSDDTATVRIDPGGLATAQIDHGIVDITARDTEGARSPTATTTMTVVNITSWPADQDFLFQTCPHGRTIYDYDYGQVWLEEVVITPTLISWTWTAPAWDIGGRLWWIWSTDLGLSYEASAWDGFGIDNPTKVRAGNPLPAERVGTMLSTWCDQPGGTGFCNGHERTNIYFTTLTQ